MDQQTVDKVLQVLREGASAASGAAKEGFQQVCAYKATVAGANIAAGFVVMVLFVLIFVFLVKKTINEWGHGGFIYKNDLETLFMVLYLVSGTVAIILVISFVVNFPQQYATMKNPAGAVIQDIIRR